jgi:flagellar motility protein MotE (MotC chaperone)
MAKLRRRLTAAEDALAAMKKAEEAFDPRQDRFDSAETALDARRARTRAQTRCKRYADRQAHERASTDVDRLQRRVRALSDRLDRTHE